MTTLENRQKWTDPRPDLYADSSLWTRLLRAAYGQDGGDPRGLFAALHGFRCCGASLRLGNHTAILDPGEITPADYDDWKCRCARLSSHCAMIGEITPADYDDWKRRYLEPHREALVCLLAGLAGAAAQCVAA